MRGAAALTEIPQHTVPDLVEMGIVANATGLVPDIPAFHAPIARTQEIADILVPADLGGILGGTNRVDVVNQLRRPDEASFAGGVFVVVRCEDRKSWEVLRAKGHEVNRAGDAAMIYRPSHLSGRRIGDDRPGRRASRACPQGTEECPAPLRRGRTC